MKKKELKKLTVLLCYLRIREKSNYSPYYNKMDGVGGKDLYTTLLGTPNDNLLDMPNLVILDYVRFFVNFLR